MTQTNVNQWQTRLLEQVDTLIDIAQRQLTAKLSDEPPAIRGPEYWQKFARYHYVKAAERINSEPFEAAKHFRRAALLGHSKSMLYLGQLFLQGEHVPHSPFHACGWLSLAEKAGETEATALLEQLQPQLTAFELNRARRLAADRFEQLCDSSFSLAQR